MIPMNLCDDSTVAKQTSGSSAQESLTLHKNLNKHRSPVSYNSDSSATVTPVLESSTETTPPSKTSSKACSAEIQTIDTDQSRTSPQSNNNDDVKITKVVNSPEKDKNKNVVREGRKGREGAVRSKDAVKSRTKVASKNTIVIRDSLEGVTQVDSDDDDDLVVGTMAGQVASTSQVCIFSLRCTRFVGSDWHSVVLATQVCGPYPMPVNHRWLWQLLHASYSNKRAHVMMNPPSL